ncbi:MAG TPA: hypothetical protein VK308_10635, partial [Pyrinomonadaceae bacterium]|nr:hypothetical protein [Pyrinomonadaceae bacterium]
PLEDREPKVTAASRRVLLQFAKGTADPNLFTPKAQAEIFPDRAEQIGNRLNLLSLPIAIIYSSELIERKNENGLRVYRYMLNDLGMTLFCTLKLTKDDKISGITVYRMKNIVFNLRRTEQINGREGKQRLSFTKLRCARCLSHII